MQRVLEVLSHMVLPKYKFEEFYQLDVDASVEKFKTAAKGISIDPMDPTHVSLSACLLLFLFCINILLPL